jgi:DNA (cytosine-5)-methyltransferase 1
VRDLGSGGGVESMSRVLNLYAGVGGNRKLWSDCQVTAVELNPEIATVYRSLFPDDIVIVGDAHAYLEANFRNFDFIWSSPPCPTHSRMAKATRHELRRYPDLKLYAEILFLQHFFDGAWCVENVVPFYDYLIPAQVRGRHAYWASGRLPNYVESMPADFINLANMAGKRKLMDWLGIHFDRNIYAGDNHCPAQILRNCVHPNEGLAIFNALTGRPPPAYVQPDLFAGAA